jgi:hypothetical protein
MDFRKVSNIQTKESVDSSEMKTQPNMQVCPCPFTPTKGAKGRLYLFVKYVASKLMQSP